MPETGNREELTLGYMMGQKLRIKGGPYGVTENPGGTKFVEGVDLNDGDPAVYYVESPVKDNLGNTWHFVLVTRDDPNREGFTVDYYAPLPESAFEVV